MTTNFGISHPLEAHRWNDRVILIFASEENEQKLKTQVDLLRREEDELIDRNLVMYQVLGQNGTNPSNGRMKLEEVQQLRSYYKVDPDGFTFILIGKDGGEKWRKRESIKLKDLFGLIDGMPMRRAEMKQKKN